MVKPSSDPEADRAFVDSFKSALKKTILLKEIEAHINDEEFARAVVNEFLEVVPLPR